MVKTKEVQRKEYHATPKDSRIQIHHWKVRSTHLLIEPSASSRPKFPYVVPADTYCDRYAGRSYQLRQPVVETKEVQRKE